MAEPALNGCHTIQPHNEPNLTPLSSLCPDSKSIH